MNAPVRLQFAGPRGPMGPAHPYFFKDRDLSAPPVSPAIGDAYIVGPSPTSAWAGHANDIATWTGSIWAFTTARAGLSAWLDDETAHIVHFNGTLWGDIATRINVNPVIPVTLLGNGAPGIVGSLVSNGETTSYAGPQFQAVFGLASKHGVGLGPLGNNVTLYSGIETWNGSGNTWGANILNRLMPGLDASVQTYQIVELDLQNDARDFGIGEVIGPGAASIGLSITASTQLSRNGGNAYRNNAALWLTGRTNSWTNGIVFSAPAFVNAIIYESSQVASTFGLYLGGTHAWGIDLSGGTISSAAVRGANNMPLIGAINAAGSATLGLLKLDNLNRLILGASVTTALLCQGGANYYQFAGSAAGLPLQISAQGTDANINTEFLAKGNGVVWLGNEHGFSFQVSSPASPATAVNRAYVQGAISGNPPVLGTVGADADVDLFFALQGAGKMRFGTHSALGAETLSGFITVKDFGGNARKLAVVA